MSKIYDVIITGARCAGTTLAIYLSRAGYRVLLVDRTEFPSDTLSTHTFFNNTTAILRELGVMDQLLETNTPSVRDIKFQFDDTVIEGVIPMVHGEDNCYCIRRTYFDHVMIEKARSEQNVTILEKFRVTGGLYDGDTIIGVKGLDTLGIEQQFRAKIVVGADGRSSTICKLAKSKLKAAEKANAAIFYGYYANFQKEDVPKFEVYKIKEHTAILFPTSDDLYVVIGILPLQNKAWIERIRTNPKSGLYDYLMGNFKNTTIPEHLRSAQLKEAIKGIVGYENYWYQGMGKGWALVGDAISFKDPSMAQGMHDAIYGARILSTVLSNHRDWNSQWEIMADEYQQLMEKEFMIRFQMGCQISKNEPITKQQAAMYKLIRSHPGLIQKFLGIYNYANEPADLEREMKNIIQP
ncbi:NAD(P)/FAD-dependent oxidoreductase [Neobacillus mesonae]|uniref:NAD(P)/FAD-dependent oxidoreductase n=1 Tax=Neobacillus mesonae TaxID=1193713 RepID=A0A3Q9QU39_9BACI|nr:NAD(P)/FAD-dependent oxidoreductase [Neobacillus mesonae]AZU62303.1 NAD(P)/FAD-dependent oxidoreductase [Neobacillus mesonae]